MDQQPYIVNAPNGIIITTKLHETKEEEDDDNNLGFEKLTVESHPVGLFIFNIRKGIFEIIEKRKVSKLY